MRLLLNGQGKLYECRSEIQESDGRRVYTHTAAFVPPKGLVVNKLEWTNDVGRLCGKFVIPYKLRRPENGSPTSWELRLTVSA